MQGNTGKERKAGESKGGEGETRAAACNVTSCPRQLTAEQRKIQSGESTPCPPMFCFSNCEL